MSKLCPTDDRPRRLPIMYLMEVNLCSFAILKTKKLMATTRAALCWSPESWNRLAPIFGTPCPAARKSGEIGGV